MATWILQVLLAIKPLLVLAVALATGALPENARSNLSDEALIERGRKQFIRCSGCHTLNEGKQAANFGPHLADLIGRESGSLTDFVYSDDMPDPSILWTEEFLDQWLEKPQQLIPGMCMPFMGLSNPELRRALILYITQVDQ